MAAIHTLIKKLRQKKAGHRKKSHQNFISQCALGKI